MESSSISQQARERHTSVLVLRVDIYISLLPGLGYSTIPYLMISGLEVGRSLTVSWFIPLILTSLPLSYTVHIPLLRRASPLQVAFETNDIEIGYRV